MTAIDYLDAMTGQLKINMDLARRVALLTDDAADFKVAQETSEAYYEHLKQKALRCPLGKCPLLVEDLRL